MKYLTVDAMISGTGIRGSYDGEYLEPSELGISNELCYEIDLWLSDYRNEHYSGFKSTKNVEKLDKQGISITIKIQDELSDTKLRYYSDEKCKTLYPLEY